MEDKLPQPLKKSIKEFTFSVLNECTSKFFKLEQFKNSPVISLTLLVSSLSSARISSLTALSRKSIIFTLITIVKHIYILERGNMRIYSIQNNNLDLFKKKNKETPQNNMQG